MKKNLFLHLLLGVFVSVFFLLLIYAINYKLFLESIDIQTIEAMAKNGEISFPGTGKSLAIKLDYRWTWYSTLFFVVSFSCYWFLFGKVFRKNFPYNIWKLCLLVPAILCIPFTNVPDYFFPIYALSCYAGGKSIDLFKRGKLGKMR